MKVTKKANKIPIVTKKTKAHSYIEDQELHERIRLFELIADHAPALISYIDKNERYHFSNKLYKEWLGYSRDEIDGKTVKEVRGKEAYKVIRPYLLRALKGEDVKYDNVLYKHDGKPLQITTRFVPHRDSSGKVAGVIGLVLDITDRKLAEKRLLEKEEQFRRLVDANVIGVVINSLDGPIYEANDIFLKMVGYSRADLTAGKIDWLKMTPPEYYSLHKKTVKEVLVNGAATPFEKEYIRKDGTRIPVLIGDVLLDKETKKTITFILDMTKQKELDQRKDEFIALASHELKTPLTSLKMYAQIAQKDLEKRNEKTTVQFIKNMDKQVDKLTNLVNDLLDVSRIQSGKLLYKKRVVAFDEFVKSIVDELQAVLPTHSLQVKGATGQKLKFDTERIKQVLTNLITNASKYSPNNNKVHITLHKDNKFVQVGIKDFGMGIPDDQQEQIFDRFFQVKRPMSHTYSGLGLGLYICKEIINRHNGEIWVESNKGKGATFFFTLPLQKGSKMTKT